MDCPVCGCPVEDPIDVFVASCTCCGAIWLVTVDHHRLDRLLVGAEG
jgi:hypothetical protein